MKRKKVLSQMTKRNSFIVSMVLIVLLLIGNAVLTKSQTRMSNPTPTPLSQVSISAIEVALVGSYKFEKGLDVTQPFIPVTGKNYAHGSELVQVFEFSSEDEARQAKEAIGTDGYEIGTTTYEWIEPPHFFQKDNVVILYFGSDTEILSYLREKLGEPFVGESTEAFMPL